MQTARRSPCCSTADRQLNLTIDHFGDIYLHASSVRAWSQTYSQLTPGPLSSVLVQLDGPRCQLFRELIDKRVVQQGEAPKGRICFAVPLSITGTVRMQGRMADDSSVFVLRPGEDFTFHMPMGMDMLAITFDQGMFERALADSSTPDEVSKLLRQPVVQVPADRLALSRDRLLSLFEGALAWPHFTTTPEGERQLEQALTGELIELLTDPQCDKTQRHGSTSDSFIVEKAHRFTINDAAHPPSVSDLCQRLRISRRTVQNSFRRVAQTTPIDYIRSLRLNGVHRDLMSTSARDTTIGDVAARWGFFHLSHFAADYRALFGELPSQTARSDADRTRTMRLTNGAA